ncbi:MAG: metal ABC transporter permease [Thermoproteota archaeon]|nr:metal ABC transporter permease [Thermoproteota archaeon]
MNEQLVIIGTGVLVSISCALLGAFLIARNMSMMSDAISHAILPGLAIAVLMTGERTTVHVVIGGVMTGILTVSLVEMLHRSRLIKEDSAIGVVFPALFSIGIILISQAGNVHIDTQHVLYGEIEYSPFDTLFWDSVNLGAKSLWVLGILTIANLAFIVLLHKELKLSTFDAALASILGFAPMLMHYLLMIMVATTAVVAFESVGAILVIALFIVPAASAYLLTERLSIMIGLSVAIGAISAVGGYFMAAALDVSIAGAMATTTGIGFGLTWLLAPKRGLLTQWSKRSRQRDEFAADLFMLHIAENGQTQKIDQSTIQERLEWSKDFTDRVARYVTQNKFVQIDGQYLRLNSKGIARLAAQGLVSLSDGEAGNTKSKPHDRTLK